MNGTSSLSVSSMSLVEKKIRSDKIFDTQEGAKYKFLASSSGSTTKRFEISFSFNGQAHQGERHI